MKVGRHKYICDRCKAQFKEVYKNTELDKSTGFILELIYERKNLEKTYLNKDLCNNCAEDLIQWLENNSFKD